MSSRRDLSAGWYIALGLLALSGHGSLTDTFTFALEPAIFLPFLVAWLAWRQAGSLATLWLCLGFLTAVEARAWLADGTFSVGLGYGALFVLLAVLATYVLSRPVPSEFVAGFLRPRWAWLKWLVPIAFVLTVYYGSPHSVELGDSVEVGLKWSLPTLAIVFLAGMDTRALVAAVDAQLCNSNRAWVNRTRWSMLAVLALLLVIDVEWRVTDNLWLHIGFNGGTELLYASVAVLAVLRIIDWRLLLVGLLAFLALDWPLDWLGNALQSLLETLKQDAVDAAAHGDSTSSADGLEQIVVTGSRIRRHYSFFAEALIFGSSLVLMATAFAPFASTRKLASLFEYRTFVFVVAALAVVAVGGSIYLTGLYSVGMFLVGITAYLFGLRWQARGLSLAPVVLSLAYLFVLPFLVGEYTLYRNVTEIINIAFYSFAFAYFGFLSNRLLPGRWHENSVATDAGGAA